MTLRRRSCRCRAGHGCSWAAVGVDGGGAWNRLLERRRLEPSADRLHRFEQRRAPEPDGEPEGDRTALIWPDAEKGGRGKETVLIGNGFERSKLSEARAIVNWSRPKALSSAAERRSMRR